MPTVFITEFNSGGGLDTLAVQPPVAEQTVAIGGTSVQSAAFAAQTDIIRVHTDAICSIAIAASPTATAGKCRMAANQTEYFTVSPAHKLAVITNT